MSELIIFSERQASRETIALLSSWHLANQQAAVEKYWKTDNWGSTLEEGLNRQEKLREGQLKEKFWVSGTVGKVEKQSVSSLL